MLHLDFHAKLQRRARDRLAAALHSLIFFKGMDHNSFDDSGVAAMKGTSAIAALALAFTGSGALAHGGGLDVSGCHHDRKRGGYHCHRGSSAESTSPRSPDRPKRILGVVYFANCNAARAAGAAPVRAGDPGYARHLDRDGDGVGCE
jgi:hypothetical protein